jgi:hypothetical protein
MQGAKEKTSNKKRGNQKTQRAKKNTSDEKRGNLKNAMG